MTQIIKQPNGKYCLFSSIVDNFTYVNITPKEIITILVNQQRKEITEKVNKTIQILNAGGEPYHQFTMNFNQALKTIKQVHGSAELKNIKNIIKDWE